MYKNYSEVTHGKVASDKLRRMSPNTFCNFSTAVITQPSAPDYLIKIGWDKIMTISLMQKEIKLFSPLSKY